MNNTALSEQDYRVLWEQFAEAHAKSEESYDSSVRTLAGGGVGVTVSIATALHALPTVGIGAVAAFLLSLTLTVASHLTAQADMKCRLAALEAGRHDELRGNKWTRATLWLNGAAGGALLVGGALIAAFVAAHFN